MRDCGHVRGQSETVKFSDGKTYKICRKCANIIRAVKRTEPERIVFHEALTVH